MNPMKPSLRTERNKCSLKKGSLVRLSEDSIFALHVGKNVSVSDLEFLGIVISLHDGRAVIYSDKTDIHEYPVHLLEEL